MKIQWRRGSKTGSFNLPLDLLTFDSMRKAGISERSIVFHARGAMVIKARNAPNGKKAIPTNAADWVKFLAPGKRRLTEDEKRDSVVNEMSTEALEQVLIRRRELEAEKKGVSPKK